MKTIVTSYCSKCQLKLSVDKFYLDRNRNKYQGYCIQCCAIRKKEYYHANYIKINNDLKKWKANNPDKVKIHSKNYREKYREEIKLKRMAKTA